MHDIVAMGWLSSLTKNSYICVCVYMHGVILLVSFVEAGVMVHGSEITFVELNLTLMVEWIMECQW